MQRLFVLFLVLLGGYLLTGVAQVRPGERAVVRRFGRVVARPAPGLWIGLPWGMDRVDRVPVNFVRRLHVGFRPDADDPSLFQAGQLLTGDLNLVNVEVAVDYTVGDIGDVEQFVLHQDRVEPAISRAAEALMAEWVGGHTVDEVLLTGKVALRDWLVTRLNDRIAPYRLGVRVQSSSITWLAAPDDVKPEFERVMIAQSRIRTMENDARQEAERLQRRAAGDVDSWQQQASAYADGKHRQADSDVKAFLARLDQYHRLRQDNPDILAAIWWAEMGKFLATMRANGQVDVLDDRIGADGLDILQFARPKKKNANP